MRPVLKTTVILGFCLLFSACATTPTTLPVSWQNPWQNQTIPFPAPAEAIGSYEAGCLKGASSLRADGEGYQVMRLNRRRYYGHPAMIRYIENLGKAVNRAKLGALLIGDVSQARGGPQLSGHNSHQMGLDVDIWFLQSRRGELPLTLDERERLAAVSVLDRTGSDFSPANWDNSKYSVLKFAALPDEVDRIFVDPLIKRKLCERWGKRSGETPWLRKIRPWWKHRDHFHVRLQCPAEGSPLCKPTTSPVPAGNGCDASLDWWFSDEARKMAERPAATPPPIPKLPVLPEACNALIEAL